MIQCAFSRSTSDGRPSQTSVVKAGHDICFGSKCQLHCGSQSAPSLRCSNKAVAVFFLARLSRAFEMKSSLIDQKVSDSPPTAIVIRASRSLVEQLAPTADVGAGAISVLFCGVALARR